MLTRVDRKLTVGNFAGKKMSFKRLWKMVFEVIVLSSDGSACQAPGRSHLLLLSSIDFSYN